MKEVLVLLRNRAIYEQKGNVAVYVTHWMGLEKNVASVFLSGYTGISIWVSIFVSGDSIIESIRHLPLTHREWSTHPVSTSWLWK